MPAAPRPPQIRPNRPLIRCPPFPTSHSLPSPVAARLHFLTWRIRGTGREARPQDVVGLLILRAPETAPRLIRLLRTPHPALRSSVAALPPARFRGGLTPANTQVMLWLPAPVSLRLNRLIDVVHAADVRTSRRQLVSALVLHTAPASLAGLVRAFDVYARAPARMAVVTGDPPSSVLSVIPPKPGRRPM